MIPHGSSNNGSYKRRSETTSSRTKIIGPLSYKAENEKTIISILNVLKASVKGESTDVIKAKMINLQQNGKTAAQYTLEIKDLRKSL